MAFLKLCPSFLNLIFLTCIGKNRRLESMHVASSLIFLSFMATVGVSENSPVAFGFPTSPLVHGIKEMDAAKELAKKEKQPIAWILGPFQDTDESRSSKDVSITNAVIKELDGRAVVVVKTLFESTKTLPVKVRKKLEEAIPDGSRTSTPYIFLTEASAREVVAETYGNRLSGDMKAAVDYLFAQRQGKAKPPKIDRDGMELVELTNRNNVTIRARPTMITNDGKLFLLLPNGDRSIVPFDQLSDDSQALVRQLGTVEEKK